jgi:Fe2+ or Zn2+ uptake regulation protein
MTSVDRICEKLRTEGRRVTPQRRAIVRVLLEDDSHLSADQVLTRVRRELPDIAPATVYNTLHELSAMGFLQELDLGLGLDVRRYQIVTERHDHLICMCCGRIEDVPRRGILKPYVKEDHGFKIMDRRVIYMGYCPDCMSDPEVRLIISNTE